MFQELILSLEDNTILTLDLFWLRDHCRCQTCYDSSNHQRKIHILDIPDDIKIKKHELTGEKLNVTCKTHNFLLSLNYLRIFFFKGKIIMNPLTK